MDSLHVRYLTDYPRCNFACEYCIAGHASEAAAPPWDGARFRRILANLAQLPFRLRIRIGVAGEFFLDRDVVEGAREFSGAGNLEALNLITNLSLPLAQYERLLEGFRFEKSAMVASFHPSQVRDPESWLQTARRMAERVDFCAMLVAYPPSLAQLALHVNWLKHNGIETFVQPFIGVWRGRTYPRAYRRRERALLRTLMYSQHDIDYLLDLKKPGLCHAGYRAVFVHASGQVYPCGGGPYPEPVGDLSRGLRLELNPAPLPCPFPTCQCDTDTINTVAFLRRYRLTGLNQHKYVAVSTGR